MKYKLLALDIDGTILNSAGELSPRTRRAIVRAKERGIAVVLATGRRLTTTLPWAQALGLVEPLIVHNGAVVHDQVSGQTLHKRVIELKTAQTIVDRLAAASLNYVVYTGESAGERVIAPEGTWREPENLLGRYLGEQAEFIPELKLTAAPIRISIIDHYNKVDPFYDELLAVLKDEVTAMLFGAERDTWRGIEIIPSCCNKGTGLAYLAERLSLTASETIAIGDNINDLEMLCWAGLGVAMENGSKVLKAQADRIAPSNDHDGVAEIIEELFL